MTDEERKLRKKERDKKYRESHKEQAKAYHEAWREKNRDRLREQARMNYHKNPQAHKARVDKYKASHIEQIKESRSRYKQENRQKCTDYERIKRQTDPVYRFRSSFICLIRGYLRKKNYKGGKKTWEIVGCDFDAFLAHIQSQFEDGMTLENYGHGEGEWNIDHIIPICTAKTDEDIERLNHYSNLRPMWASDNYKRPRKIK